MVQRLLFILLVRTNVSKHRSFKWLYGPCIDLSRSCDPVLKIHALILLLSTGFAFAFGGQADSAATTFIGSSSFASIGSSASFWFFQYTFSATSVTIVAGTLAERCQMAAYLCYSIVLAGFVYPVVRFLIIGRMYSILVL